MKKALSLLLILVMLIGMIPMQIFATEGTQETEAVEAVTEPTEAPEEKTTTPAEDTEEAEPSKLYESEEDAEAVHEHDYEAVVTDPTCTEEGYTAYTCDCGDSYVDDYVDATGHKRANGICSVCGDSFAGKKVSILSASTSTYAGVSNNTAANSTIGKNDVYYTEGRYGVYQKDMWWQQVIDVLDMELLVNNAWSGSCIFQPRKGAASVGYGNRAVNLHNDHTGEEPDIVWVYIGSNDFAYYQDTFGKAADVDYSALIQDNGDGTFDYAAPTTTCEAYAIMLHKIENRYPGVEIYCMPALARRDPDYAEDNRPDPGQPTAFNAELIAVAEHLGCTVINWENCIPKEAAIFDQYIGDKRAHPNAAGMDLMSQAVISGMLGRKTALYDISGTYTNVYTDNNAAAAMAGGDYRANLTADQGSTLDVTVTMGGMDVTQSVYSNGTIYIENITGDIKITAVAYRAPQEFRWEVVDGTLTSTGKNKNTLTALAESISDGVIQEGRYQLETPVMLKQDQPWVMEWKCAGDWRGILLSTTPSSGTEGRQYLARTKGGQLCFGIRNGSQSNNYGVDLSKLDAQSHTYRLENRIAADGSNMVWLYLDGNEVGPMNNYFLASKDQGTTSDWINGKDFVFPYIGMDTTPVTNCRLDYFSIQEAGHTHTYTPAITAPTCTEQGYTTYTCACGNGYTADFVDATGHSYENGICTSCGIVHTSTFQILDTRCNRVESFTYEVGMTWKEWLNSKYNTGMGSCIAIWVGAGPDILGYNPYMDIFVNGACVDYDDLIQEQDTIELVKYQ